MALVALLFLAPVFAQLRVNGLLTENLEAPLGLDTQTPHFSWQIGSSQKNVLQAAYEIKVRQGNTVVWNSSKVGSDSSVYVPYRGKPLQTGLKYHWQVRVWDNQGKQSAWSSPAAFQMGLLYPSDWKAQWIEPGFENKVNESSPLFRKDFAVTKKIQQATAFITSYGMYEAYLNGARIGEAWLTPGWTSYKKRLQYQAYDVTPMVKMGKNAVGAILGSGWYRSKLGWNDNLNIYGNNLALLFQLTIHYTDGSTEQIISDGSWKSSTGEIVFSEIYDGEIIDARKEKTGWLTAGYNDAAWTGVNIAHRGFENLLAQYNEPVKKQEVFKPVKLIRTPKGEQVIDFGQNLVGWVVMKVKGQAGDTVTLSHAEVLDKKGNFYTDNLRVAKAQNKYILKGAGEERFHPHFTWQGFRYLKIEGYPGEIRPENFEAVALYSDMKPTGSFTSSSALINQLQHNIEWGQRGNFLDVPTDCPQRDERLGWTGDAQAFSRTATFNMQVHNFFAKWLQDLEADQVEGRVPHVIPNVLGSNSVNSTGWADVATIAPWNLYLAYGDLRFLARQYNSMKAFVESVRKTTKNDLYNTGTHYGDWLFYRPDDDNSGRAAVTDKFLIAQCFYAHSTQILQKTATLLGKTEDAAAYNHLLDRIKSAFLKEYVTPSGRLVSGTQTAYVLALYFDMLPEALRQQAAQRLVENIKSYGHLTTGFLGTPYLCHVLTNFGYTDVAYQLLEREKYPSWLYPVKMGATTIWERWDGQKPDSSFQTPGMNSFNHYAYGAIGDWMYRAIAGLDTYENGVGYKHIKIKPHPGGSLTYATATLKTYYGTVSSGWRKEDGRLVLDITIPANTKATVFIPSGNLAGISESGKPLSRSGEIQVSGIEGNYTRVEVGSGAYQFTVENFKQPSAP